MDGMVFFCCSCFSVPFHTARGGEGRKNVFTGGGSCSVLGCRQPVELR